MPVNKLGSYIVHYRSRKKEEAEQERQRRIDDAKRAPKIIDPSFELFGHQSPQDYDHLYEEPFRHDLVTPPASISPNDDWTFQNRRASAMPQPYQMSPFCEITPKTSVSSTTSACSDIKPTTDYDMGWDTTNIARPRPQSCLPSITPASHSLSMSDLHRGSAYRARKQLSHHENEPTKKSSIEQIRKPQSDYTMEASLTKPFSMDDPLEIWSESVVDDQSESSEQTSYDTTWDTSSKQGSDGSTPRPST